MDQRPDDLDQARAASASAELIAEASAHLTNDVAVHLPFESLGPFKTLLKRFFSRETWSEEDADELSALVVERLPSTGWWEHTLSNGTTLGHGIREQRYELWVSGAGNGDPASDLFDRVFSGPVTPEATPHPRKVKFNVGGSPAPGHWYLPGDTIDDARVERLLEEEDVTDVMVAGDFVTVGLDRRAVWEERLDPLLDLVTDLFFSPEASARSVPPRTRDELVAEGLESQRRATPEELHLLDPDDQAHRARLEAALDDDDARIRRVAVATLAQAEDAETARRAVQGAYEDESRLVRRTAVDSGADREDPLLRSLFEQALADTDAWTRWKAVRSLAELGIEESRHTVAALADDPDFRVRMEAAAALRGL